MTDEAPTLKDIWRLLGTMNKRFDSLERRLIEVDNRLSTQIGELSTQYADLSAQMRVGFGTLKASIEARDFRLDEHGRRITDLETLVRG